MSILSGLGGIGLGGLEGVDLFAEEEKEEEKKVVAAPPKVEEKDLSVRRSLTRRS